MKTILLALLTLTSCTTTPTWSHATQSQRDNLLFRDDAAYHESAQFQRDDDDSVETILRLEGL